MMRFVQVRGPALLVFNGTVEGCYSSDKSVCPALAPGEISGLAALWRDGAPRLNKWVKP